LIALVDKSFDELEPTKAGRAIQYFVNDELSNWYVRLCRRRFWKGDYDADKISAYQTLYTCLETVAQLMAPVAPFFADWLYRNLNEGSGKRTQDSVHLTDFPTAEASYIDPDLEERMGYAQKITSLVFSLRKKEKIRVRQPLQKILLPVLDASFQKQIEGVTELIESEVNVKEIEFINDASGIIKKKVKPNFKTLGRRLGKDMKAAAQAINSMGQEDIAKMEKTGVFVLEVEDRRYELGLEDFEIITEDIPGWLVANEGALTVALDVTITDEQEAEGMARELVNRIQNIRKNRDFALTDRIKVVLERKEDLVPAIEQFGTYISQEVLADELSLADNIDKGEQLELPDDLAALVSVEKI
ncbi:MAG: class I tRNA ligase family protein, partial [Saprospiraceae bacterium]|nr:class I tRNA ligase family protein [Saprospiraceae bacterium]